VTGHLPHSGHSVPGQLTLGNHRRGHPPLVRVSVRVWGQVRIRYGGRCSRWLFLGADDQAGGKRPTFPDRHALDPG